MFIQAGAFIWQNTVSYCGRIWAGCAVESHEFLRLFLYFAITVICRNNMGDIQALRVQLDGRHIMEIDMENGEVCPKAGVT